jgi:hypothetical protein
MATAFSMGYSPKTLVFTGFFACLAKKYPVLDAEKIFPRGECYHFLTPG